MASISLFLLSSLAAFIFFIGSVESGDADGPVVNVTRHISFPDFKPSTNPRFFDDLKLLGSSVISNGTGRVQIPDTTQKVDLKHLAGRAFYSHPIRVFDPLTRTPASFQTTFTFQLENILSIAADNGSENSGGRGGAGGSGFTFIMAPDEFTVGRPGPWLGMLNDACDEEYKTVGVEFDTRENPEFGDPNDNHLGINLGSIVSTITINASEFGVNLKDGEIHRAWIAYYGESRYLDIRLASGNGTYPSKPIFSGRLDISPYLKEYMFVGFSASTGNFTQIHNLISWNFTSTSKASLRIPSPETCESKIIIENDFDGGDRERQTLTTLFIFTSVVVLVVAVVAVAGFYCYGKRRKPWKSDDIGMLTVAEQRPRPPNKPRRFTISEVSSATRCFNDLQKLGGDERSDTYRGSLLNGCHVAVKRFSTKSEGLDRRRVAKEIKAVSKVRHPNLVPVRGWCFDHQETMVVYDYMPNGSLENWLFGVGVLPWTRRFKVVRDVAEGLSYLHSQKLAHKNVKMSSVFLDVSFRAVLGDFGFVMSAAESKRFESAVSQQADVFEFGVLVVEVVAGRRRYADGGSGLESDLLVWAWSMHESDEKAKVVDGRIGSVEQAVRVMEIGLLCTLNENKGRPSMAEVAEYLSLEKQAPELPPSRPVALFPYSSATGLCTSYSCASFK